MECRRSGDSQFMRLPSKAAVKKLRRVCVMLNVAGITVNVLASGCAVLLFGPRKNLVLYSFPFFKSDQLWSFFIFFTAKVIDWSKNYF